MTPNLDNQGAASKTTALVFSRRKRLAAKVLGLAYVCQGKGNYGRPQGAGLSYSLRWVMSGRYRNQDRSLTEGLPEAPPEEARPHQLTRLRVTMSSAPAYVEYVERLHILDLPLTEKAC